VFLLLPVTASAFAGPEMKRMLFWPASGAICTATPDEIDPPRIL
jgi:hypothetical protein